MTIPSIRSGAGSTSSYVPTTGSVGYKNTHMFDTPTALADGDTLIVAVVWPNGTTYTEYSEADSELKGLVKLYEDRQSGHSTQIWAKQNASAASSAGKEVVFKVRATSDPAAAAATARVTATCFLVINANRTASLVNATARTSGFSSATTVNATVPTATPSVTEGLEVHFVFGTGNGFSAVTPPAGAGSPSEITEAIDAVGTGVGVVGVGVVSGGTTAGASAGGDIWTITTSSGATWSTRIMVIAPVVAVNSLRPDRVVSNPGAFSATGGAASIQAALADESDSTGAQSPDNPAGAECTVGFGGAQLTNANGDGVQVKVRDQATAASPVITRVYKLYGGASSATLFMTWPGVTLSTTATDRVLGTDSTANTALAGVDRSTLALRFTDTAA